MSKLFSVALIFLINAGLPATAQNCDFLDPVYFANPSVTDNASACLNKGYTFAIQDPETLNTPLHFAARDAENPTFFDQLAILIPSDLRQDLIEVPNSEYLNPFHLAVVSNRAPSIIVQLGRWGDVINSMQQTEKKYLVLERGTTALHLATKSGVETSVLLALLALGADPTIEDSLGNRPIYYGRDAENSKDLALLLDRDTWAEMVAATTTKYEADLATEALDMSSEVCSGYLSSDFFENALPQEIWRCTISWSEAQSDPENLWTLRTQNGDNAVHLALKENVGRDKINALLGAAKQTGGLKAALSAEDKRGWSPIHIAAEIATDPLVLVELDRWGANVDQIANARDNGFLKSKTGTTAMHLAARRGDSEDFIAALLATGADPFVYDNNTEENPLTEPVGLTPIDYMSRSNNLNSMALIAPRFSVCKVVSENTEAVAALVGLGAGATGTATLATSGMGISAVAHSSGAVILTGSSGYIAGTLGTIGSSALAVLTAPAALTAAAVSVVAVGGTVYYCSSDD